MADVAISNLTNIIANALKSDPLAIDDVAAGETKRITIETLLGQNRIINGDFDIWQRGTSFAAIATGKYSADRFKYEKSGTMVHTITRSTDVPTQAQSEHKSNYSIKIDCTTTAAIGTNAYCIISQPIEGYNFASLMGEYATLVFWVKSPKTGIHCVSFRNSGSDRSYVVEYTINTANTWEEKTVKLQFSESGGTWDYTTGKGIVISWALAGGSNYQGIADTWNSANDLATSNQVNVCDNVANDFYLAQVRFVPGQTAIPYPARPKQIEDILNQRYFQKSYNLDVDPGTNTNTGRLINYFSGVASANHTMYVTAVLAVVMRAAPTIALYAPAGTLGNVLMEAGEVAGSSSSIGQSAFTVNGTNGAVATARQLTYHYTADAEL